MAQHVRLEPRPAGVTVPLTAIQKWYWIRLLNHGSGRSPFRFAAMSVRFCGPLNIRRLEESIESLVRKHESLRTRIACVDGEPTQVIDAKQAVKFRTLDLTGADPEDGDALVTRLGQQFLYEEIDLEAGPLLEAMLLELSASECVLILAVDHIVSDGVSFAIIAREVLSGLGSGEPAYLESTGKSAVQFPDYAVWQYRGRAAWQKAHAPYWRDKLAGLPRIIVPPDGHAGSANEDTKPSVMHVPLGKRVSSHLARIAHCERSLLALVILTLHLVLMSRWCQREELLVEFTSHGRYGHSELRDMVGCLVHAVFLRVAVKSGERIRELLQRVTAEYFAALSHDPSQVLGNFLTETPTEVYFNWLPGRTTVRNSDVETLEGGVSVRPFPITKETPTRLAPVFMETPSGVIGMIFYSEMLFRNQTLQRFALDMRGLAEAFVKDPNTTVAAF